MMLVAAVAPPRAQSRTDRLTTIAANALDGLSPVVVVNRRTDAAQGVLTQPADDPLPTIHTDGRRDLPTVWARACREFTCRIRGTYGDGADAGHTGFGSIRFVADSDAARGADSVIDALRAQGDAGVRAYGPVSFVTDASRIAPRTTYAADDTGLTLAPARPQQELPVVVAERLTRSGGTGSATVEQLLDMPTSAASDVVRGWLLSDRIAVPGRYMEAQIRRLTPHDFTAVIVDRRPATDIGHVSSVDPGSIPDAAESARILQLAADSGKHVATIDD